MHHVNPTCGDEVTLRVRLDGDQIAELGWDGEGCSISQASTSVMSELVSGKPIADAMALERKFLGLMQSRGAAELTEADEEELDDAGRVRGRFEVPGAGQVRAAGLDGDEECSGRGRLVRLGRHPFRRSDDRGVDDMTQTTVPSRDEVDEAMRDVV